MFFLGKSTHKNYENCYKIQSHPPKCKKKYTHIERKLQDTNTQGVQWNNRQLTQYSGANKR